MAFRPDTKYYIGSKEYDTIYEAFDAVRTMAKGTVIKDKNGTTVFTKDNNSNTYHLYQFNEYYGESADQNYSSGEVLPGLTNNSYGKMLTWLNNFAYSKAVDGNGELSNSRIRTFFRHSDVSLKAIYEESKLEVQDETTEGTEAFSLALATQMAINLLESYEKWLKEERAKEEK